MLNSSSTIDHFFIGLPSSNPRILIPLASPLVQASSFGLYSPGSIQGKLFKWLGKTAAITGIMNLAGRFFAVPVETFKATETIQPILKNQIITGLQSDWEAALGKEKISFALSLGEPNYYRKITALIFDKDAKPIAFAKVACTEQAGCLIANERMALETLSAMMMQSAIIPALLGQGKTENASWILQSPLLSGRSSRNDLRNEHIAFLSELAQKLVKVSPLNSSDIWKYLQVMLKSSVLPIKSGFESERPFVEQLSAKIKALNDRDVNKPWPFTFAHGDFAPWNMRLIDDKVVLYDWEYFLPLAPAGWDLLYFIFRVENLIKRQSLEQIWRKFESGAYLEKTLLCEKKAGLEIPDRKILATLVILAIALDLAPKIIADKQLT